MLIAKIVLVTAMVLIVAGVIIVIVLTVPPKSTLIDRCKTIDIPYSLWIRKNNGGILISWNEPYPNYLCDVTYLLQYSLDGREEFQTNTTFDNYTIPNLSLEICSILQVNIWVISQIGEISEDSAMATYTEVPYGNFQTNFNHTIVNEDLLVTWDKPIELMRCEVNYTFTIRTDVVYFRTNSVTESIVIPDEKYCFRAAVDMQASIDGRHIFSAYSTYYDWERMDSDRIIISTANSEELIVRWYNHPKEEICDVDYDVEYYNDAFGDWQYVNVRSPEARFNFTYCAEAVVFISTNGLGGSTWGPLGRSDATQYPEFTYNISVTSQEISWYESPEIDTCNTTYLVNITTDISNFSYNTTESSIDLSEESYCLFLIVQIHPVLRGLIQTPTIAEHQFDLKPVENLQLIAEASSNILIGRWTKHTKQELCGIEYRATYGDGGVNETKITDQTSISFDISYCTTAFIIVEAVSSDTTSESEIETYYTGSPGSIGKVQDIIIDDTSGDSIIITWKSPAYVTHCNIVYTVTATHPSVEGDTCSGFRNCAITLSEFCPITNLVIVATLLDGQPVSGEPTTETYIC